MTDDALTYNHAYFIRFSRIKEAQNMRHLNNYIFPNFHEILKESGKIVAIDEDENGQDTLVLFISQSKIESLIQFCEEEGLIDSHYDISIDILRNDVPEIVQKMMSSDEFSFHFDKFIQKNLTVDLVLDKIMIHGRECLTEFDKKILIDGI